jgi:hypothetical protein
MMPCKKSALAILFFLFMVGSAVSENWDHPVASDLNIWIDMDSVRTESNGNKVFWTYVGKNPKGPMIPLLTFKIRNAFNCATRVMYEYVEDTKSWDIDTDLAKRPEFIAGYLRLLCR